MPSDRHLRATLLPGLAMALAVCMATPALAQARPQADAGSPARSHGPAPAHGQPSAAGAAAVAGPAPSHAQAPGPYRLQVVAAVPALDWRGRAPAALAACERELPPAPAPRPGAVRVINIVKDRYFLKFFADGRLPRLIAQQQDVPRALVIDSGSWRLPALARAVGDERLLSRDQVLGLPLLIRPGAALVLEKGDWLRLDRARGAFILNLGELQVRDARVSAWDRAASRVAASRGPADFRPYLLGWGGSRTVLDHSLLESLGFGEALSHGLQFARGPFGLRDIDGNRPPQAWITRNRISDGWAGVRASGGAIRVCGNVVDGAHAGGVLLEQMAPGALVARNQVSGVRSGQGIALASSPGAWVVGNLVQDNAQSGIVVSATGGAWIAGNRVRRNRSDGIRLQGSGAAVLDNESSANGDHGLSLRDGGDARVRGLLARGNGGAAIEAVRTAQVKVAAGTRWRVEVSGGRLEDNAGGALGLERPWELVAGDLVIVDHAAPKRQLLRAELNSVEGALLRQVVVEGHHVRVAP